MSGTTPVDDGAPLMDIEREARRVLGAAQRANITSRLLGGIAIAMLATKPIPAPLRRTYADIDLIVKRDHAARLRSLLERLGYVANQRFNNLHGERRLLFYDEINGRQLDVFIEVFKMCHELPLRERLDLVPDTLPPADLLLTKLQIVEINRKDLLDLIALLALCEIGSAPAPEVIDLPRLIAITSHDWGWYTTVADNLARVPALAGEVFEAEDAALVTQRVAVIQEEIQKAPKSLGWKVRSRVGRRVSWYDLPEEVAR